MNLFNAYTTLIAIGPFSAQGEQFSWQEYEGKEYMSISNRIYIGFQRPAVMEDINISMPAPEMPKEKKSRTQRVQRRITPGIREEALTMKRRGISNTRIMQTLQLNYEQLRSILDQIPQPA